MTTRDPDTHTREPVLDDDPFAFAHETVRELRAKAALRAEEEQLRRSFWRELPVLVLIALVVAIVIKTFLFQAFFIPSSSMEETLQIDDRVLVNKLSYRFGEIERGDVIVFDDPRGPRDNGENILAALVRNVAESIGLSTPQSEFIKRVVAISGDTVEVAAGQLLVNGEPVEEPYLPPDTFMRDFERERVPDGFVYVMGDNRGASQDSRFFGPIPEDEIVGKAFVILWPPSHWGGL